MDYDLSVFTSTPIADKRSYVAPELALINDSGKLKICKSYSSYVGGLESVILDFLKNVDSFDSSIFLVKTLLQVGVYYSPEESVTFSVRLSNTCISELNSKKVDIDICGYPCSD